MSDPTRSDSYDRDQIRNPNASYWTSPETQRIGARGYADPRVGSNLASCARCRTPWAFVNGHATTYDDNGRGCSILCEECWAELHIDGRIPYYFVWYDRERVIQELGLEPRGEPLDEWLEVWPRLKAAVERGA